MQQINYSFTLQMFVRLFVDENLDRMVPISKQPKDKIQAILEACDRQFPEFHIRSRKRIRTYLKSCRRMRRSKEQNGWEQVSCNKVLLKRSTLVDKVDFKAVPSDSIFS